MTNIHTFNESKTKGDIGETKFYKKYKSYITETNGRIDDFVINSNNQRIELKTDSYDMNKTENFFMERYSDINKKTAGGPWRAKRDNIEWFIYYFIKNDILFVFPVESLVEELEKLTNKLNIISIPNRGYFTGGFKVPRISLEHILIDIDTILDIEEYVK